ALTAGQDALIVSKVFPGGGAEEAGIAVGDGILKIDGLSVIDLGMSGSIEHIRGPEGTTVDLTVRRGEGGDVVDILAYRRKIKTCPERPCPHPPWCPPHAAQF